MTKKELIQTIKNEIKAISSTFREHKKALRKHYSDIAKYGISGYSSSAYKYESKFTKYLSGFESIKCHLTCLHIAYNILRNNKQHCHNEERNNYYVKYFKDTLERMSSYEEEKQDANLSSTSPA